jgi:hypothetical protein
LANIDDELLDETISNDLFDGFIKDSQDDSCPVQIQGVQTENTHVKQKVGIRFGK